MVNEVTYSQLAKIAQEQGKNVLDVAKERGISEAQLADMQLKDAKFNGEPGAPADTAQYSVKYDLNVNGVKSVLSIDNLKYANGRLELSNEAKTMLDEFGVKGIVMQDGVVYAQHKDGQNYPIGDVSELLDIDMAYVNAQEEKQELQDKYNANRRIGSSAWEMIKGSVMGLVAVANPEVGLALGVGAVTEACQDKNEQIQIAKEKDYTKYFEKLISHVEGLRADIKKLNDDMNNGIIELSSNDQKIIKTLDDIYAAIINFQGDFNENAGKVNSMLKNIETWLEFISDNQLDQINILIKNGQSFDAFREELMDLLRQIESNQLKPEEREELFNKIISKMNDIEAVNVDTNKKVTEINETVKNLKLNFQYDDSAILEAIDKLAAKGDTANRFLELILDAMAGLGDDMRSYFGDLIKMAIQGNANIDDLKKLMTEINNNVKANGKQAHDDAQAILAAIKELGVDVSGDLAKILNAIRSIPDWQQKDYSDALQAILDKINEGNKANDANFKAVLAKIGELGAKVTVGMNAILDAIKNQPDYSTKLDAILKKLDALGSKAQEILEAIKDHDVKITVDDLNVKVTCECNCGNGGKHEGIIGDLKELLG